MNRNYARRSLRTVLAGWLRVLLRRSPVEPGPNFDPAAHSKAAGPMELAQADADQGEVILSGAAESAQIEPGEGSRRSGPPEHWLSLARSKGPPQHWLDLIRARLGVDFSRVPWIKARVLPAQLKVPAAQSAARFPPASEKRPAPPVIELVKTSAEVGEEGEAPHLGNPPAPERRDKPMPVVERRQPAAMRLYPAPVEHPRHLAAQPRLTPREEVQPADETAARQEWIPHPAPAARPQHVSEIDTRPAVPPEAEEPPPLLEGNTQPARIPAPAQMAPVNTPHDARVQTPAEPLPRELQLPKPQVERWPAWRGPSFERYAAALEDRIETAPPAAAPTGLPRALPPRQDQPLADEPPAAPNTWPAFLEPAPAERRGMRELFTSPPSIERWPALGQMEDEALAGDEWESYQRAWQRIKRLHREQQGLLWNEWPF